MLSNEILYLTTRDDWRVWLQENHAREKEIWLGFFRKRTGRPSIPYEETVEEALCFGWVDSIIKNIDDERYARKFTPRKDGAVWSQLNKARAEKMIRQGRMAEAGLAKIVAAKRNGEWQVAHNPPRFEISNMPSELEEMLSGNQKARKNFEKLASSDRRRYVVWVAVAKQSETRVRRAKEAVSLLEKNQKLGLR